MKKRRGMVILDGERTETRGTPDDSTIENPYWSEPEPHPNPELGCVRRGLCCKSSPGWFAPGEVEGAAALLGMEPDAFVKKYLVVDFYKDDKGTQPVFVPVKVGRDGEPLMETGGPVDELYTVLRSPCVFFKDSGCGIYAARPLECQRYICTNKPADNLSHGEIADMWRAQVAPE